MAPKFFKRSNRSVSKPTCKYEVDVTIETTTTFQNCLRGKILTGSVSFALPLFPIPPPLLLLHPTCGSYLALLKLQCIRFLVLESIFSFHHFAPSLTLFSSIVRVKGLTWSQRLFIFRVSVPQIYYSLYFVISL